MTTIAQTTDVQSAGSLLNGVNSGGPSTAQLNAALARAQREMEGLVTKAIYIEVRDYDGEDTALLEKQEDFKLAEAHFALAHLPDVLRAAQMSEKGFVIEEEIGKAITRYGEVRQSNTFEDDQRVQAMLLIAEYIDLITTDETGEEVGIQSADGSFSFQVM